MTIRQPPPGFSLLEFLISLSIITFLITGTAQLIIHSFFVKRQVEINLKMAELASLKLEYFKSLPYESGELKESHGIESLRTQWSQESFQREWRIQDISSNLKKVEIEIYSESHPHKKVRLVLFISRELGF